MRILQILFLLIAVHFAFVQCINRSSNLRSKTQPDGFATLKLPPLDKVVDDYKDALESGDWSTYNNTYYRPALVHARTWLNLILKTNRFDVTKAQMQQSAEALPLVREENRLMARFYAKFNIYEMRESAERLSRTDLNSTKDTEFLLKAAKDCPIPDHISCVSLQQLKKNLSHVPKGTTLPVEDVPFLLREDYLGGDQFYNWNLTSDGSEFTPQMMEHIQKQLRKGRLPKDKHFVALAALSSRCFIQRHRWKSTTSACQNLRLIEKVDPIFPSTREVLKKLNKRASKLLAQRNVDTVKFMDFLRDLSCTRFVGLLVVHHIDSTFHNNRQQGSDWACYWRHSFRKIAPTIEHSTFGFNRSHMEQELGNFLVAKGWDEVTPRGTLQSTLKSAIGKLINMVDNATKFRPPAALLPFGSKGAYRFEEYNKISPYPIYPVGLNFDVRADYDGLTANTADFIQHEIFHIDMLRESSQVDLSWMNAIAYGGFGAMGEMEYRFEQFLKYNEMGDLLGALAQIPRLIHDKIALFGQHHSISDRIAFREDYHQKFQTRFFERLENASEGVFVSDDRSTQLEANEPNKKMLVGWFHQLWFFANHEIFLADFSFLDERYANRVRQLEFWAFHMQHILEGFQEQSVFSSQPFAHDSLKVNDDDAKTIALNWMNTIAKDLLPQ